MRNPAALRIDAIDPSSPDHWGFAQPIAAHTQLAPFYAGRPPYIERFFRQASDRLGLSPESVLIDLCCGRGELASGFSGFVRQVVGVDGSDEMLRRAIRKGNIDYRLCDVNEQVLSLPRPADHLVIGSAIHWVRQAGLQRWLQSALQPGGRVLVTHALLRLEDTPWRQALEAVNARYGKRHGDVDLWGAQTLDACGYARSGGLRTQQPTRFDFEYLLKNQLSYLYGEFLVRVTADPEGYRCELLAAMAPYIDGQGMLGATLVNWGLIYSPIA